MSITIRMYDGTDPCGGIAGLGGLCGDTTPRTTIVKQQSHVDQYVGDFVLHERYDTAASHRYDNIVIQLD